MEGSGEMTCVGEEEEDLGRSLMSCQGIGFNRRHSEAVKELYMGVGCV